jgi:serine phosphatase RsbU (regulator of sigma subunit)/CHASE3 domain sensor protein
VALRTRLAIALGALLLVVGVSSAWSLNRLDDVRSTGREVVQQAQPAMTATNSLTRAALDVQIETALYVLTPTQNQLDAVTTAKEEARTELALLQSLALSDEPTREAVDAADTAYTAWIDQVIDPVIAAIDSEEVADARAISSSDDARALGTALEDSLRELQDAVVEWRTRTVEATTSALTLLERALIASLIAVALTVVLLWWGLRRWVTLPLTAFGKDLRLVAEGDLEHRIPSSGPPDVASTMRDAEDMRQRLLHEIDDAIAAREALNHRGPVVAALRRELRASTAAAVPGLDVAGLLIPAEGVLAGDWFDVTELPDGRLGLLCVDVAGHGPLAGLAALRLKYAMTSTLRGGAGVRAAIEAAAMVLEEEDERFAAAVAITVSQVGEVAWCSAGHPTPMIVSATGEVDRLEPTGPIVTGLGGTWTVGRGTLPPRGSLLVVSDGILESRDNEGRQLSEVWRDADVADIVNAASDARDAAEQVAAAARARAAHWRADDITVLAIRRT